MRDYQVGDRVIRPVNVYEEDSPLLHGEVVFKTTEKERYPDHPYDISLPLYDVRWDGKDTINKSYFWHGLDYEEEK